MPETKQLIERAAHEAPLPEFSLDDVRARRDRRQGRRRLSAGIVAGGVTIALVAFALAASGSIGGQDRVHVPHGGVGLPPATRDPVNIGPSQYSYQHLVYSMPCTIDQDAAGTTCPDVKLDLQSWWTWDDSGRIERIAQRNWGGPEGTFGPGAFHTEGDLTGFPSDPEALKAFLLERSGPGGASPRPDVTPSPGVPLEDGLLWNAIRDYFGSTQYLNTTPALRASMLEVLATVPMVSVDLQAHDPVGREAIALRFVAYGYDVVVFVDPASHDFLGMTDRYLDQGPEATVIVQAAGATATTDQVPTGANRSIPTAP